MTLQQIIDLKEGDSFLYQNQSAQIIWREYVVEEIGVWDKEMKYAKHFAIYFKINGNIGITLRSMHPHPNKLNLPDYEN